MSDIEAVQKCEGCLLYFAKSKLAKFGLAKNAPLLCKGCAEEEIRVKGAIFVRDGKREIIVK
jgi:hypothetical protein